MYGYLQQGTCKCDLETQLGIQTLGFGDVFLAMTKPYATICLPLMGTQT